MMNRQIAILDAPSNLGLRPPESGSIPGCYKLPWALRDRGLLAALNAVDAGALVPPRYRADWQPGDGDRNADAIVAFSIMLADRVQRVLEAQQFPLVLGGDCSILLGNTLALKHCGRYGLVFLDAHSDFRHPDHATAIGAAAGEDLAIVTGRGDARLIHLQQQGPYVRDQDIAVVGIRPEDEYRDELQALGITVISSAELAQLGLHDAAQRVLAPVTAATQGFWIHLDWDVVDASEMSAVDCPEPNGPSFAFLAALLTQLLDSPQCVGLELTIYDPDLDLSGCQAERIIHCLKNAFQRP